MGTLKWYGTNDEVLSAWVNYRSKTGRNGGRSIWYENYDVIYSYGTHFPLAVRVGDFFILNGDKYGSTTSTHQSKLFSIIPNKHRVEIPFSALAEGLPKIRASIYPYSGGSYSISAIQEIEVLHFQLDKWVEVPYVDNNGEHKTRSIHQLGACLFEYKNKRYISGIDGSNSNRTYFLTELKGKPETVEQAFDDMKPDFVVLAESGEMKEITTGNVKRQGEWFFVELTDERKNEVFNNRKVDGGTVEIENEYVLKPKDERRTSHYVTRGFEYQNNQYVSGVVRHSEGDHSQVKLYEGIGVKIKDRPWWIAVEAIQGESWTASGSVD